MSTKVKYPRDVAQQEEFYTAEELAKKLKLNVMTIYRHIKGGRLKAQKIGKEFRIPRKEFENFMNKHEQDTTVAQSDFIRIMSDKDNKILRLEKELERMKKSLRNENYGLAWIDVPEAFEDDVENKLPIVNAVPKLDIKGKDGATHLLIEAENYHALTCLNYTHKGKIDVIYIDPPYNTGSDGFRYKDKRVLEKYPDGAEVPVDHPLRHSYWLSFMRKRLELAKELLTEKGLIFISIDDNEIAQLKLLADQVFGESNFINNISVKSSEASGVKMNHTEKKLPKIKEYVLVYAKNAYQVALNPIRVSKSGNADKFKSYAKYYSKIIENPNDEPEKWKILTIKEYCKKNKIKITSNEELIKFKLENADKIVYRTNNRTFTGLRFDTPTAKITSATGLEYIWWEGKQMLFLSDYVDESLCDMWSDISTINMNKEMAGLPSFSNGQKPLQLIERILKLHPNKRAIVLDFFAGSGTTGHATLRQNKEDGGSRQFILITNNDEAPSGKKQKIMTDFCHPRLKRVMKGHGQITALGGSLKYYRIGFVGENSILNANDKDKLSLAHNAGELLAIAENTLGNVEKNEHYEIFENKDRHTAIYFKESFDKFDDFTKKVLSLRKPTTVYIFSWENDPFVDEFEDNPSITVKTIPEPILEIYRRIYNL